MATELAKAYVQIIPSAKGIKGSIAKEMGGEAASAGTSSGASFGGNLVSKVKGIIAAAGIGAVLKKTIQEGADLQQSIGGIETLFGAGGANSVEEYAKSVGKSVSEISGQYDILKESENTMMKYANEAYKSAGLSANDYMQTVSGFAASLKQSTGGDMKALTTVANQAVIDMADNANKMGTDMTSIQNAYQGFAKQNYTMLDNLKLGYGGTKQEMQRLLKDASAISGIEYNIDNLDDVYSAIHVIQGELGITGTTAKEAASTLSGSFNMVKSAATNVLAGLTTGQDVTESMTALTESIAIFFNKNLVPMIGNLIKSLPSVIKTLLKGALEELNFIADNADTILQYATDFISELAIGIISNIPLLFETAVNLLTAFGQAMWEFDWLEFAGQIITSLKDSLMTVAAQLFGSDEGNVLTTFLSTITDRLPLVLNKGVEIITNLVNGILENMPAIINGISTVLTALVQFIFDNLPTLVNAGATLLTNLVTGIVDNLPKIINAGVDLVNNLISGIISNIPQLVQTAISLMLKLVTCIWENYPKLISAGFTLTTKLAAGIVSAVPQLIGQIPAIIKAIWNAFCNVNWSGVGKNIINGIKSGIKNAAGSLATAAKDAAGGALKGVKNFLGIHSPSRVFRDQVGKMIDLGLAAGIENNTKEVSDSIRSLSDSTIGAFDTDFYSTASVATPVNAESVANTNRIMSLLEAYLPGLANSKIVLDTGATIGELAPGMNDELGRLSMKGALA